MLNNLSDILPKAAVAAIVLWGGVSYFILAPEIGSRVVKADHLPACEANFRVLTAKAAEKRFSDLPPPSLDYAKEATARQLRALLDNPFMAQLDQLNIPGMSNMAEVRLVLRQYEEQKQAAVEAYNSAVEKLKRDTATDLGMSGSICGCIADVAISDTRTDWALFSGSFGLIRPASLRLFDQRMEAVAASGQCGRKAGA